MMLNAEDLTDSAKRDVQPEPAAAGLQWLADHGDLLFNYALSRVRDAQIAEDLVQETLLSAIRGIDSFQHQSAPATWLVGILRHKLVDYYRVKTRERSLGTKHPEAGRFEPFSESGNRSETVKPWGDPSAAVTEEEFQQVMRGCMDELPELSRQAFEFRVLDDLESQETCRLLGISAKNLAARMYRARLAMRECLSRRWF